MFSVANCEKPSMSLILQKKLRKKTLRASNRVMNVFEQDEVTLFTFFIVEEIDILLYLRFVYFFLEAVAARTSTSDSEITAVKNVRVQYSGTTVSQP